MCTTEQAQAVALLMALIELLLNFLKVVLGVIDRIFELQESLQDYTFFVAEMFTLL